MTDASRNVVVRSPADVLRLVVAAAIFVVVLLAATVFDDAVVGFLHDLVRGVDAFGDEVVTAAAAVVRGLVAVFLVGGLVAAVATRRWRAAGTVVLAGAAGALLLSLVDEWVVERRGALVVLDDVAGPLTADGGITTVGLAVAAGALAAGAPWLSRGFRRAASATLLLAAFVELVSAPLAGLAGVALASGWAAGSAVLVLLGGPLRRPTRESVAAGLESVGVELAALEPAAVDARGSTPYFGTTVSGEPVFVKVLGTDERSADLLFRLYRYLRRRGLGDERPFGSLRQAVEHEALVASMARGFGIRTPRVLAIAIAEPAGVVLTYEGIEGRSLDRVDVAAIDDDVVREVWMALGQLRRHRLAHRDLRLANLFLDDDGAVWIIDFGFAQLAASDAVLASDVAELATALAIRIGTERVVAVARATVGDEVLRSGRARLRPAALSGATARAVEDQPGLIEALRGQIPEAVGGAGTDA